MIELSFALASDHGDFRLDVRDESRVEVLGLFGPSGAGKTTMLEMIAGLRTPAAGHLRVAGRTLFDWRARVNVPARHRHIGYVPQDVLLFPHLDVRRNLLYGARQRHEAQQEGTGLFSISATRPIPAGIRGIAGGGADGNEAAPPRNGTESDSTQKLKTGPSPPASGLAQTVEILDIGGLLKRRVQTLSGGERQRVAIGRALMTEPALLLLDEPLAGVDRARRERILPYLLRIRRELHVPLVYVTHDAEEMMQIADRVLIIDDGQVVRAGAPVDVLTTRKAAAEGEREG